MNLMEGVFSEFSNTLGCYFIGEMVLLEDGLDIFGEVVVEA